MANTGKLTLTTFLTLDGVMQAPGAPTEDPSGNFEHGGWLVPYADADMGPIVTKASRTLARAEWHNSTVIRGDIAREVAELKRKHPREIQVHGSGDLAQTLLTNDLVDEFRLWLYPVVLGSGKRLFGSGAVPAALELVTTNTTSTGVVVSTYRRAGKPAYGSFALDQT